MLLILWMGFVAGPLVAQHHGKVSSSNSAAAAPAADPDVESFKHAVIVQATDEQSTRFRTMISSVDSARQRSHELHLESAPGRDSIDLEHKATSLLHVVDQAQSDYREFRKSLTDPQEAELKDFTKKLTKADEAVGKAENSLSEVLQQGPLDPGKLASTAQHLERALTAYRADQASLGKEMGIRAP
jgi:hypothetical protein